MEYTINDEKLKGIKDEVLVCKNCSLYNDRIKNRYYPVIGEGNHQAHIMFIGEAPGFNEAKTGRPFCGAAGIILTELLKSIGIERKDVYIANLLKCRPPSNRDPLPDEIKCCSCFLERQIAIIKPKVICPLGRYSMKFLMEKFGLADKVDGISKIHGKIFEGNDNTTIIPFYHPAVATYREEMKSILLNDIKILEKFK